jgi:hypothetical protein
MASILDIHPGYSAWWIFNDYERIIFNPYTIGKLVPYNESFVSAWMSAKSLVKIVPHDESLLRAFDSAYGKGSYAWNRTLL